MEKSHFDENRESLFPKKENGMLFIQSAFFIGFAFGTFTLWALYGFPVLIKHFV